MRKILILLALLGSLLGTGIQAQDDDMPPIYLVFQPEWYTTSTADTYEAPDWMPDYLSEVNAKLFEAGYRPIFVTDAPEEYGDSVSEFIEPISQYEGIFVEPPYSALHVSLLVWQQESSISLSPYAPFPYEPLPMGTFGFHTTVHAPENIMPAHATDLMVGIALYVVDDCENAIPFLEAVQAVAKPAEFDLFVYSAPRFYEANCQYKLGDVDAAITLFEDILAYEAENIREDQTIAPLWFTDNAATNLAAIYIEQGEIERAETLLDQHQLLDLESHGVFEREFERFFKRADLYLAIDQPEKMIAEMDIVIDYSIQSAAQNGSLAWLYTERGYRYELIGDTESALADYEQAIQTDPEYPVSYYRRGLLQEGDQQQQDFEQFLELAPNYVSLHHPPLDEMIADAESRLN